MMQRKEVDPQNEERVLDEIAKLDKEINGLQSRKYGLELALKLLRGEKHPDEEYR